MPKHADHQIEKVVANFEWTKYWSGMWSLLTGSLFGYYYTQLMKKQMGAGFSRVVLISRKGYTTCYFEVGERKKFGMYLGSKYATTIKDVRAFCKDLKQKADHIMTLLKQLKHKQRIMPSDMKKFLKLFYNYTGPHISPRNIVDYLSLQKLEKVLTYLEDARLYTESVYKITEEFMQAWAIQVGAKEGYKPAYVLCMLQEELECYLNGGALPSKKVLQERFGGSALIFFGKISHVVMGEAIDKVENTLIKTQKNGTIKGMTAYPGQVRGIVRIVFDPKDTGCFNKGDILVTGMTRPEFLLTMKKAAAFVTDGGGVLCHAAIVARELKKPCVVGTEIATKVFKDGDVVEVDAERGIVRKL